MIEQNHKINLGGLGVFNQFMSSLTLRRVTAMAEQQCRRLHNLSLGLSLWLQLTSIDYNVEKIHSGSANPELSSASVILSLILDPRNTLTF